MVTEKYFSFLSSDGETQVSAKYWIPDGKIKAVFQITHGMIEYKERYNHFAEFLANNGFLVAAHDHTGHGDSVAATDDWGYIKGKHPSETMINDMNTLRQMASKDYPDVPYIMLGHSMGSYLLRQYLGVYGEGLSAAVVMGTGYNPPAVAKIALFLVGFLTLIKGSHYRSKFIQGLTYTAAYKEFNMDGSDLTKSWLNRDPEMVKKYYSDPKCTFRFTLAGHKGLFEAVARSCSKKYIDRIEKTLPVLLVSGEKDPVGDLGKGVKTVFGLYKAAGLNKAEIKLFPEARHEILNEINRQEVYDYILKYVDETLG